MRERMEQIKKKYAVLLCIVCEVLFFLLCRLFARFIPIRAFVSGGYLGQLISEIVAVAVSVLLLWITGELNALVKRGRGFLNGLGTGGFLLFISAMTAASMLFAYSGNPLLPASEIIVFVLFVWCVGMAEEFLFRGVITRVLMKQFGKSKGGIYIVLFISGFLFGMAHLINLFAGIEPMGVIVQAVMAVPVGALFTAIYLRCNNIWAVVFLHAFIDFAGLLASGLYGVGSMVEEISAYSPVKFISLIVYMIPLFVIMRNRKMKEIMENFSEKENGATD